MKKVWLYTDGASRGNPGHAAAGWVVCDAHECILLAGGLYLGKRTNNEAEYIAAIEGLKVAKRFGDDVVLRADSQLMIKQLLGEYQVRDAKLIKLYQTLMLELQTFTASHCQHIRRELNTLADRQANLALDAHLHQ